LTRSQARLGGPPAAAIARDLARATGLPEAALRQRLEDSEPDLRLGAGLPLALGGGALSALGGLLTVAWARRRPAGAGPSGPS
ncbi:MAG TPA: hypothetical protein VNO17_04750, partial [Actinomycetota bacterium]|nr:hypothetical protein [Actinomycetota bacterium]